MKNILFVCTGNTCRSPMASFLLENLLQQKGMSDTSFNIQSAGVSVWEPLALSEEAKIVLKECGIDATKHQAQPLTKELLDWADHIYVMTPAHANQVLSNFPEAGHYLEVLGEGIMDPYGGSIETYQICRDEILLQLEPIADQLIRELQGE